MKRAIIIVLSIMICTTCLLLGACKKIEHDQTEDNSVFSSSEEEFSSESSTPRTPVSPISDGGAFIWGN